MKCIYCNFYQLSPTRINNEDRFCNHVQKIIEGKWEICEDGFEPYPFFWCNRNEQRLDMAICVNRQNKGMQECNKCRQKDEILEIRKIMGRRLNGKPKLIKKIVSEEIEPEIVKPKIILHRRVEA